MFTMPNEFVNIFCIVLGTGLKPGHAWIEIHVWAGWLYTCRFIDLLVYN